MPRRASCGADLTQGPSPSYHFQQTSVRSHAAPRLSPTAPHGRNHHPGHSPPRRRVHVFLSHDSARETTADHLPFQWRLRRPRRTARKRAAARGASPGRLSDVHQQRGAPRRAAPLGSKRRGGERGTLAARRRGRRDVRSIRRVRPRQPRRGVPRRGPGVLRATRRRRHARATQASGGSPRRDGTVASLRSRRRLTIDGTSARWTWRAPPYARVSIRGRAGPASLRLPRRWRPGCREST